MLAFFLYKMTGNKKKQKTSFNLDNIKIPKIISLDDTKKKIGSF